MKEPCQPCTTRRTSCIANALHWRCIAIFKPKLSWPLPSSSTTSNACSWGLRSTLPARGSENFEQWNYLRPWQSKCDKCDAIWSTSSIICLTTTKPMLDSNLRCDVPDIAWFRVIFDSKNVLFLVDPSILPFCNKQRTPCHIPYWVIIFFIASVNIFRTRYFLSSPISISPLPGFGEMALAWHWHQPLIWHGFWSFEAGTIFIKFMEQELVPLKLLTTVPALEGQIKTGLFSTSGRPLSPSAKPVSPGFTSSGVWLELL